jgi:uncharacterized protein with NRDE domain
MCLILFAIEQHARYPLIIAANRDESYHRPTARLAFWPDAPNVAAGRDLEGGGTWLGITRQGRWAALTNYRQAGSYRQGAPSRGRLVSDYLLQQLPPDVYVESVRGSAAQYNGFSLLVGFGTDVYYLSNRAENFQQVVPGSHGLSNHLLDTPWPKVADGMRLLQGLPDLPAAPLTDMLLQALQNHRIPPDNALPDTGVGIPGERILSPTFIVSERYGTRASTVILVDRDGAVSIVEHTFGALGKPLGVSSLQFVLEGVGSEAEISRPT